MSKTDSLTRMIESDIVHIASGDGAVTGLRAHTLVVQEDTIFSVLTVSKPSSTDDSTTTDSNGLDERKLNSKTLKQGAIISLAPSRENPNIRTDRFFSAVTLASGSVIAYVTNVLE